MSWKIYVQYIYMLSSCLSVEISDPDRDLKSNSQLFPPLQGSISEKGFRYWGSFNHPFISGEDSFSNPENTQASASTTFLLLPIVVFYLIIGISKNVSSDFQKFTGNM